MRSEEEAGRAIDLYGDTVRRICMVHLKNAADTEDKPEEGALTCQVKNLSMDQWKKVSPDGDSVIVAYYRNPPTFENTNSAKDTVSTIRERQERPQRVVVYSDSLIDEIEETTDLTIPNFGPAM